MGSLHFDITATDVNFKATLNQVKANVEAATKTIENLGNGFDVSSVQEKVKALNSAISYNENSIASLNVQLRQWQTEAMEAAANGDMSTFRTITKDIEDQVVKIQDLINETNEYRNALSLIGESGSVGAIQPTESVKLFKSQDDYNYAEQLKSKIQELQAQIGAFNGSADELRDLTSELSNVRDELGSCEQSAAQAATKLGAELGGKAAEASTKLYELNNAIEQQSSIVKSLEQAVMGAANELSVLTASSDATTDEIAAAQANYDALAMSLLNAQNGLNNLQAAQIDAKNRIAEVNNEISTHANVMVRMLGGYDKYTAIIGKLPQPIQMVITSMQGMTGAAKAFIATPLGAIIAAIVLALQTLKTWFNSSAEGQMAFAKVSGYVSGILGQLKEVVIAVGNAIYKAFSDPKQAVSDLWHAIKTNIVNRFKALGQLATHVGELISAAFTPGQDTKPIFKSIGDDLLQLTTGVENLIDKTTEWADNIEEIAQKTSELKAREEQLHRDRSAWSVQEQVLENKLKELRSKAMSGSKTDRIKAQKEAKAIVDQIIDQRKKFAQEEYDIIRERNALTTNSQQDYDAENEAQKKLLAVESDRTQMMMSFTRQAASAERSLESLAEQQEKAAQRQKQAYVSLLEKEEQLRLKNQQAKIDLMDESHDKRMAQIEQEYQSELNNINTLENDFKQLNKKAGVTVGVDGLTDNQRDELANRRTSVEALYTKNVNDEYQNERDAMNEYLKEFGTYLEKRQAMIALANEKIAKATTEGEKKSIAAQLTRDLSDLDIEATKTTNAISKLFGDMSKQTVSDLRAIADAGQQALDFLTSGQWDETKGLQFGITKEMFETLRKSPAELDKILKAIRDINAEADNSENAFNKIKIGLDKIFNNKPDTKEFQEGFNEMLSGVQAVTQALSFMSDALSNLGAGGAADVLNEAVGALNAGMQGAQAGAAFGPWGAAAGAAIGVASSLAGTFSKLHDKKHEKRIQAMQEQVEALGKSYDNLGDSVENAFSKDASNLLNQQNEMLAQQKVLIQNQIKEEEAKKNTDNDRIKEWKEQLESIDKQIGENKEKAVDAIFGEDLKSAIENFADAYANAWANGENRAESAKDTVKKMMQQMVTESIKAAIKSSNSMEQIRKKLQEFYADNVLSGWEQDYVLNMAEELQRELDEQFGWADKLMSGNNPGAQSTATAGVYETLSEDTGQEISGRLTAAIDMLKSVSDVTSEGNTILSNILYQNVQTNEHLSDILIAWATLLKLLGVNFNDIKKAIKEQA